MEGFTPEEIRVVEALNLEELEQRCIRARVTEEGARHERQLCLQELRRRRIQVNREAEG